MQANKIKYVYKESDGSEDYEILELNDTGEAIEIVSLEAFYEEGEG